ncbi:hypothetical protein Pryu01_02159 [Paraliobacillus ryukyuensis]|uniref:Uncharacterized protein n=1 Tax=Paraliobacillus ryukyuensis TaxID=200904 RepID=A0A366E6R5_9BACI|nr:hypothetical protein [Paraliobacillus ryukyuensis]RBO97108.1 hypothetical protein DES48_10724 [Paraliobacillus ryukyuensis]
MTKKNNEDKKPIKSKQLSKITQYKGKTREEKRHEAMLNKIKKLEKDTKSYL